MDRNTAVWFWVSFWAARDKVGHSFRDAMTSFRKKSSATVTSVEPPNILQAQQETLRSAVVEGFTGAKVLDRTSSKDS